ncbi:hypothetical protein [Escherichia phage GER2]|nr:hypothetical protein [Escherichia phage GER2]DAG33888.1 MAG TPA: hypothetical protein [Caudoviricetes sp.]
MISTIKFINHFKKNFYFLFPGRMVNNQKCGKDRENNVFNIGRFLK